MPKPITVQTIAELIARPGEGLPEVVNRVRNWTKEGLIETIGERNPGTGRRRHYPETAATHALILSALREAGVQAGSSRGFSAAFHLAKHAAAEVEQAEREGSLVYLVVRPRPRRYSSAGLDRLGQSVEQSAHLYRAPAGKFHVEIDPGDETSIVINLTILLKRLRRKES